MVNTTTTQPDYLKQVLSARVYDVAIESPLQLATKLSDGYANQVYLKREDEQLIFSFKLRGAYNKLYHAKRENPKLVHVVAASAGNHAQGVALAAQRLDLQATIVMPRTTPTIKVDAVRRLRGRVILEGDNYDQAAAFAKQSAVELDALYIPPFDDPDIIAGQGTVGLELLKQLDDIDAVFVPVGGGGLLAGLCAVIKAIKPETKIIAVEPVDAACFAAAKAAGHRVVLDRVGQFADGVAVAEVGEYTFAIANERTDDCVTVTTDEMCAAIKDIFDDTRTIVEPAGALSLAGLKKYVQQHRLQDQKLIAIVSGANSNFDRLRHVAERADIGQQRETLLSITIPEKPGAFYQLCCLIGRRNITEFNYRFANTEQAQIFVGIETQRDLTDTSTGLTDRQALLKRFTESDYPVVDMSQNEMAKQHVRFMVGGHSQRVEHEQLYRFSFPERPGALMDFLRQIGQDFNISLFHYRNQGADYGRVLVGIQIPPNRTMDFTQRLDSLGYEWHCETSNPAYQLFLSPDPATQTK